MWTYVYIQIIYLRPRVHMHTQENLWCPSTLWQMLQNLEPKYRVSIFLSWPLEVRLGPPIQGGHWKKSGGGVRHLQPEAPKRQCSVLQKLVLRWGCLRWKQSTLGVQSKSSHTQSRLDLKKKKKICVKALRFCYRGKTPCFPVIANLNTRPREKMLKRPSCDPRSPRESRPWLNLGLLSPAWFSSPCSTRYSLLQWKHPHAIRKS